MTSEQVVCICVLYVLDRIISHDQGLKYVSVCVCACVCDYCVRGHISTHTQTHYKIPFSPQPTYVCLCVSPTIQQRLVKGQANMIKTEVT